MREEDSSIEDEEFLEPERPTIIDNLFDKQFSFISAPRGNFLFVLGLAIIFLLLGIGTFLLSYKVQNIEVTYANNHLCTSTNLTSTKCSAKFEVPSDIQPPIYLLYKVKNMYINHRKFLNSYSLEQIKGEVVEANIAE